MEKLTTGSVAAFLTISLTLSSANVSRLEKGTINKESYDQSLLQILSNYTDIETYLHGFLKQNKYAELKEIIDEIEEKIPKYERIDTDASKSRNATETTTFENTSSLKSKDLEILQAYQNATIYNVIYALWNWKIDNVLPEIDQNAILEYYGEKDAEKKSRQSLVAKVWTIIKNLFQRRKDDDDGCHANKPECIRLVLKELNEKQKLRLKRATRNRNLVEISTIIEEKIFESADFRDEYSKWKQQNNVPKALRDIVEGLTDGQLRAMKNLRRLKLKNAIKDYYRGMIERRTPIEQQEIEEFFRRMNKTFAKCYNPSRLKEASIEIANKFETWRR